jgi:peptide deformylase
MTETPDLLLIGDPRLRAVAKPCGAMDHALLDDLERMRRTLEDFRVQRGWGRALAAPQIGLSKRAIVYQLGDRAITMLNPQITWRSVERVIVWDDCFSLPHIAGPVVRHASVSVCYQDEEGRPELMEQVPTDVAELVQHEIDHLEGVLFVDLVVSPTYIVAHERKTLAAKVHADALRGYAA